MKTAKTLKAAILKTRPDSKATQAELNLLLKCQEAGDWSPMMATRLYQKFGGEYCELLGLL